MIQRLASSKNLKTWAFVTAAEHFLLFLLLFLVVSYLSTLLKISDTSDNETIFISKYEKYIVLSSSLYMIAPFASSTILLLGLFHKKEKILDIFLISSYISCFVILVILVGSGIFLAIKGTDYVAYSLIAFGIFLELVLCQGIVITLSVKHKMLQVDDKEETGSIQLSTTESMKSNESEEV